MHLGLGLCLATPFYTPLRVVAFWSKRAHRVFLIKSMIGGQYRRSMLTLYLYSPTSPTYTPLTIAVGITKSRDEKIA